MSKYVNHIDKEITKTLKPYLTQKGFFRIKPKKFVRIRGDLIDVIFLGFSRWGEAIYLYCGINSIYMPDQSPIDTYSVGDRFISSSYDDTLWVSTNEDDTHASLLSMKNLITKEVLPWFDTLTTTEDYVVEKFQRDRGKYTTLPKCSEEVCKILGKNYHDFIRLVEQKSVEHKAQEKLDNNEALSKALYMQAFASAPKDKDGNIIFGEHGIGGILDELFGKQEFEEDVFTNKEFLMTLLEQTENIELNNFWLESLKQQTINLYKLEKVVIANQLSRMGETHQ